MGWISTELLRDALEHLLQHVDRPVRGLWAHAEPLSEGWALGDGLPPLVPLPSAVALRWALAGDTLQMVRVAVREDVSVSTVPGVQQRRGYVGALVRWAAMHGREVHPLFERSLRGWGLEVSGY